ncbi:MAG TPA: hypothetical protein VFE78_28570 [Gemmataceae bacterium]|jgi:hypothetical protein|nr:hypothetical protein [Gemmataceae bacterium]
MSSQIQQCQACGRLAEHGERFDAFCPAHAELTEGRAPTGEDVLCPACAAERRQREHLELAYRFCDQCVAPVEPNQVESRSKTTTALGGPAPFHSAVTLRLCPRCASAHDGTGRWLMICLGVVGGGIFILGLLVRLLG